MIFFCFVAFLSVSFCPSVFFNICLFLFVRLLFCVCGLLHYFHFVYFSICSCVLVLVAIECVGYGAT
jgi:hypothetical protein